MNLDSTLSDHLRQAAVPDVLVVPSDLNSFAKLVSTGKDRQTLCINPGRVAKGSSSGTFAYLQVAGSDKQEDLSSLCHVTVKQLDACQ